jgi:rare lipoprotein A
MLVGQHRPVAPAPAPVPAPALAGWVVALLVLCGGCATRATAPPAPLRDGAEARPPAGLEQVPDAEPRVDPLRQGGPNKPYTVLGVSYVPMTTDQPWSEAGLASWYGRKYHRQPTSSGEPYDMYAMTAAHKTMPIPSYARVRNPANGREVIVRINDRGPFAAGRVIDLSYTAALKLGLLGGVAPVEVQRLTHDEIRTGTWREGGPRPDHP